MDIEVWAAIPGYEEIYEASNNGRIRRIAAIHRAPKPPFYLRPQKMGRYFNVSLHRDGSQKSFLVHRLVMATFNGPNELEVNHIDGDKANNALSNLEYVTPKQNGEHAAKNGLTARGERQGSAKMTAEKVRLMRYLHQLGATKSMLTRKFKVSAMTTHYIIERVTWRHIR